MLDRYPINSGSSIAQAIELITANLDNPTELNAIGTAVEDIRLVHESVATSDRATLYRLDTSSDSVNAPYVMASATAGLRWVAIAGYAINQMVRQNAGAQSNAYEIVSNINAFSEMNIQNTNAGSATSSDLVATSSDGTSTTIYTDWGINGAGGGAAPFTAAHEAYGYTDQNVLNLGALGTAASLRYWVGATPTKIAQMDIASGILLQPVAITTGVQTGLTYTDAANTGLTASTEVTSINLNLSSSKQWSTGALGTQRFMRIQAPTITFVGSSTVTKAVTLSIGGAPIQGTNATLTTTLALEIESGISKFSDTTDATSSTAAAVVSSGGLAIAKKLNVGDSTPSTSISTGSVITAGGYAASRSSFLRGVASSGDSNAIGATFFANQSVDPSAFKFGLDFQLSTSGATAGNSSETIGIQAAINGSTANTYGTIAGIGTILTLSAGTYTSAYGLHVRAPVLTGSTTTTCAGLQIDAIAGAGTNNFAIRTNSGIVSIGDTTDATSKTTASVIASGGVIATKTLIHAAGRGAGFATNATVAGTITLSATSAEIQTFTGSTAGTVVQFPAANLRGSGISVLFTINNQSTQTVTPTRAGADTFQGGGTTDPVVAGATTRYASDGVSVWMKI